MSLEINGNAMNIDKNLLDFCYQSEDFGDNLSCATQKYYELIIKIKSSSISIPRIQVEIDKFFNSWVNTFINKDNEPEKRFLNAYPLNIFLKLFHSLEKKFVESNIQYNKFYRDHLLHSFRTGIFGLFYFYKNYRQFIKFFLEYVYFVYLKDVISLKYIKKSIITKFNIVKEEIIIKKENLLHKDLSKILFINVCCHDIGKILEFYNELESTSKIPVNKLIETSLNSEELTIFNLIKEKTSNFRKQIGDNYEVNHDILLFSILFEISNLDQLRDEITGKKLKLKEELKNSLESCNGIDFGNVIRCIMKIFILELQISIATHHSPYLINSFFSPFIFIFDDFQEWGRPIEYFDPKESQIKFVSPFEKGCFILKNTKEDHIINSLETDFRFDLYKDELKQYRKVNKKFEEKKFYRPFKQKTSRFGFFQKKQEKNKLYQKINRFIGDFVKKKKVMKIKTKFAFKLKKKTKKIPKSLLYKKVFVSLSKLECKTSSNSAISR